MLTRRIGTTRLLGFGMLAMLGCGGGGGDGDSVPLADLKTKGIAAVCGLQVRCGSYPDQASCEVAASSQLQIYADESGGKTVYDGQAAARCLNGYAGLGCNVSDQAGLTALAKMCGTIFKGTVANGGACLIAADCVSQSCNTGACGGDLCCAGTCQDKVPAGGDCLADGSVCVEGAYCHYDGISSTATCKVLVAAGQPCTVGDLCVPGTSCLVDQTTQTPGTCAKPPAEGEPCPVGSCDSPQDTCDPTSKTCVRRAAVGVACSSTAACVAYATCDPVSHVCVAGAGLGAACVDRQDCSLGLLCSGGVCAKQPDVPACP